jgi:membrane protein
MRVVQFLGSKVPTIPLRTSPIILPPCCTIEAHAAVSDRSIAGSLSRSLSDSWQAFLLVLSRFREARCADAASNLAFTTLIAIVPLLAIGFAIVSVFPVFSQLTDEVQAFAASTLLPQAADRLISVYLGEFAANAARVSLIGLAVLVVTALVLVLSIESAFDDIWRTGNRGRRMPRLAVYSMLVTVGPLLIGAGLWLTSLLVSWSMGWFPYLDDFMVLGLRLAPFALTIAAFALLYYALPNQPVRFADAVIGGLVAGVLFEITKRGFGLYVTHIGSYQVIYGAFATVPIFLVWIYLSWLVVLIGAVLVAVMPQVRALGERGANGTQREPEAAGD